MESPFISQVPECKSRMRKLRKKISKHNNTLTQKKRNPQKLQDLTSTILNIFQKRHIPASILSTLRNKRNVDIFSLKSLVIGNQEQLKMSAQELKTRTQKQEKQVEKIYRDHCQRMQQLRKVHTQKSVKKVFSYFSSTQGQVSSQDASSEERASSERVVLPEDELYLEESILNEGSPLKKFKVGVQAFSSFQMGQSSILSGDNIFNF